MCGAGLVLAFAYLTWKLFDRELLAEGFRAALRQPGWLLAIFAAYSLSFVLKGEAWRRYVDRGQPLAAYVHGVHYSLLVNHLLPVKAGDLVRAGVLMKAAGKPWDIALHSVAAMRLIDLSVLGAISVAGMLGLGLAVSWIAVVAVVLVALLAAAFVKLVAVRRWPFARRHYERFADALGSGRGLRILGLVALSWLLEAAVLNGVVRLCGLRLDPVRAVWANSVTIGGQVFQVTPGGVGTYESVLGGSLAVLGVGLEQAYVVAVLAHAFKFAAAFVLGGYSVVRLPIGLKEARSWIRLRRNPVPASPNKV